jgi:hypothetical protein
MLSEEVACDAAPTAILAGPISPHIPSWVRTVFSRAGLPDRLDTD